MKTVGSGWQPVASLNIAGDAVIPPLNFHNLVSAYHSDVQGSPSDGSVLVYRTGTGKWGPEPIVDTVARANANMTSQPRIFDDFISGSPVSGDVGDLGWQFTTIVGHVAPSTGRVGVVYVDTSAISGTYSVMHIRSQPTIGVVMATDTFDLTFALRLQQTDADTLVRFGMGNDSSANPPADGIYTEKLAADTQWFGVTRASSSETRTAALGTTDTNWHKFRMRRKDASTISFSIDGGPETDATANIPTVGVQPFVAIRSNTTTQKRVEVDFIEVFMTGMRP